MVFITKKRTGFLFLILSLLFCGISTPVLADNEFLDSSEKFALSQPLPTFIPSTVEIERILNEKDPVYIPDMTEFLSGWNDKLDWNLSDAEIQTYSKDIVTMSRYVSKKGDNGYSIANFPEFQEQLGKTFGLTTDQMSEFKKQLTTLRESTRTNYRTPSLVSASLDDTLYDPPTYVNPTTHSAPYASGKIFYLYIFVNFTHGNTDGNWTLAEINDAMSDAYIGTNYIQTKAPAAAGIVNDGGYYMTTVYGRNDGSDTSIYQDGWLETALYNIGFRKGPNDNWISDYVARAFKSYTNSDCVVIVFFTHDYKGAYAVLHAGYADKGVVSYWGGTAPSSPSIPRDEALPESYQHEILHLFGAADEYSGQGGDGGHPSYFAVSPMNFHYRNTNHHNSTTHDHDSVMCQHRDSNEISLSTKRFIGWGDHDNDGILDPEDAGFLNLPYDIIL